MKKNNLKVVFFCVVFLVSGIMYPSEVTLATSMININGRTNHVLNPVRVFFEAGTYTLDPISVADGGLYNAISYGPGQGAGRYKSWHWWYCMENPEIGFIWINEGQQYLNYEMDAFAAAVSTTFTLTTSDYIKFYILDGPGGYGYAGDNIGGISLLVNVELGILYVDDDAPADPGPSNLSISDPFEDGSREHPFDMIQEGIDVAKDGDAVVVLDGTYWETIDFEGKSIEVTSFDPDRYPCGPPSYPVIDGNEQGPVVTFNKGEDHNCKLTGFVITRGLGNPMLDSSSDPVPPISTTLTSMIRDFRDTHPDFEDGYGPTIETGIVMLFLGSDGKPVYAKGDGSSSVSTHGQYFFDQWYRDVSGVNLSTTFSFTLNDSKLSHFLGR